MPEKISVIYRAKNNGFYFQVQGPRTDLKFEAEYSIREDRMHFNILFQTTIEFYYFDVLKLIIFERIFQIF